MIVTPAQAGVQLKVAWIPAFAGMTNRYQTTVTEIFMTIFLGHNTEDEGLVSLNPSCRFQ